MIRPKEPWISQGEKALQEIESFGRIRPDEPMPGKVPGRKVPGVELGELAHVEGDALRGQPYLLRLCTRRHSLLLRRLKCQGLAPSLARARGTPGRPRRRRGAASDLARSSRLCASFSGRGEAALRAG